MEWNDKMPKIHVIRSLGRTLFFSSFVGWCFSHIYKNTMLLHRRSVHSVSFAISHLFSVGSVHWKYFRVSVQTNRLVYKHPGILIFFCCQSLKSNPQTEISTLFSANSLPLLASSCLSFLALRIVSDYVLLFACFNCKTFFAASVLFGVLVIFALRR